MKKKFSNHASQKRERRHKISHQRETREKDAHNEKHLREREGKEKKNDDVRFNNQYSYEYYYY